MSLRVTNDNDGLESGTLTGTSLLLDGLDLQEEKLSVSALRIFCDFVVPRNCEKSAYLHDLILQLW